jgi:hypothetical protein
LYAGLVVGILAGIPITSEHYFKFYDKFLWQEHSYAKHEYKRTVFNYDNVRCVDLVLLLL